MNRSATIGNDAASPPPRAPKTSPWRRLSLALTGSVPSLEEIRQFEPQPPEKRLDGWANHLLHDRRFADYFADRLARAYVGMEDGPLIAYRKRRYLAWLSDELLKNTSYAEIVRQMIAAQGLNTDKPAVNFIAASYDDNKKTPDPEKLAIRVSRRVSRPSHRLCPVPRPFPRTGLETDALPGAGRVLRPDATCHHEHSRQRRRRIPLRGSRSGAARTRSPRPCRSFPNSFRTRARAANDSRPG